MRCIRVRRTFSIEPIATLVNLILKNSHLPLQRWTKSHPNTWYMTIAGNGQYVAGSETRFALVSTGFDRNCSSLSLSRPAFGCNSVLHEIWYVQIFVSVHLFGFNDVWVSASNKSFQFRAFRFLDTNEWRILARQPCARYKIHKVYWSTSKILWNIKAENENSDETWA